MGAILLIVAGGLGLVYGRLSFSRETHRTTFGPVSLIAREQQAVTIPIWGAVGAIVLGSLVLLTRKRGMRT